MSCSQTPVLGRAATGIEIYISTPLASWVGWLLTTAIIGSGTCIIIYNMLISILDI